MQNSEGIKSNLRVLVVRVGMRSCRWKPPRQMWLQQQLPEGLAELARHCAVQHEVDGPVQQRQEVHQLPEEIIAALEEAPSQQPAHQAHDPLRQFCY